MISLPWRRSSAPRVIVPLEFSPARGRSVFTVAALSLVSGLPLTLSAACSMADPFTYADTPARECSAREAPDPSRSEWPSATRYARHLEAYYDAISPAYDDWSSGVHRRLAARLVEVVSPLPGARVLDVGCGSGGGGPNAGGQGGGAAGGRPGRGPRRTSVSSMSRRRLSSSATPPSTS